MNHTTDAEQLWRDNCPSRFVDATDDLDAHTNAHVESWVGAGGRNLLLLGPSDVGKTHAALVAARRWLHVYQHVWWFVPLLELLNALRESAPDPNAALDRAMSVPLLVLDDLGFDRPIDWTLEERLYIIVNQRWLDQRPTVATSNLTVEGGQGPLVDAISARTYSRLVQDAVVVQMAGRDLRRVV